MQFVSSGENKKNITSFSFAEFAKKVVIVKLAKKTSDFQPVRLLDPYCCYKLT